MQKLILRNFQSPGDILMLTAAVRDLHACYPGRFVIDVRTPCPDLWLHNPHLTPLDEDDPDVARDRLPLPADRPQQHRALPLHPRVHRVPESTRSDLQVKPTLFKGDLHLSAEEREWFQKVEDAKGQPPRFWLFASGGKHDYTIKWWSPARYQEVVDHFQNRLDFVQVGEDHHHHPPLERVIDLRGQTTLRQLFRLMYHAGRRRERGQPADAPGGRASRLKPGMPRNRPCVVVAGGREPPHFTLLPAPPGTCTPSGRCPAATREAAGSRAHSRWATAIPEDQELCVDVVGTLPALHAHDHRAGRDPRDRALLREGGALPPL